MDDYSTYELYRREASAYPMVTPEEERRLATRVQAGDSDAMACLINANLRLVLCMVQDYKHYSVPLEDLIAEGNLGLIKAVEHYDGRTKFWNYAETIIHRYIQKVMAAQGWVVRVPTEVHYQMLQIRRESNAMEEHTGAAPSDAALAKHLEMPEHKVATLRGVMATATPIDTSEDEEYGPTQSISDGTFEQSGAGEDRADQLHRIGQQLDAMEPRERLVLEARYGLRSGQPMILESVGEKFGVSRERMRQIQASAEAKVKTAVADEQ
jgi:RNA polymerase primary sigma factor